MRMLRGDYSLYLTWKTEVACNFRFRHSRFYQFRSLSPQRFEGSSNNVDIQSFFAATSLHKDTPTDSQRRPDSFYIIYI